MTICQRHVAGGGDPLFQLPGEEQFWLGNKFLEFCLGGGNCNFCLKKISSSKIWKEFRLRRAHLINCQFLSMVGLFSHLQSLVWFRISSFTILYSMILTYTSSNYQIKIETQFAAIFGQWSEKGVLGGGQPTFSVAWGGTFLARN